METAQAWFALGMLILAATGLVVGALRNIYSRISDVDKKREADINAIDRQRSAVVAQLHEKIDAIKDKYVRRDDLERHLSRIEDGQRQTQTAVTDLTKQVQQLTVSVTKAMIGRRGDDGGQA